MINRTLLEGLGVLLVVLAAFGLVGLHEHRAVMKADAKARAEVMAQWNAEKVQSQATALTAYQSRAAEGQRIKEANEGADHATATEGDIALADAARAAAAGQRLRDTIQARHDTATRGAMSCDSELAAERAQAGAVRDVFSDGVAEHLALAKEADRAATADDDCQRRYDALTGADHARHSPVLAVPEHPAVAHVDDPGQDGVLDVQNRIAPGSIGVGEPGQGPSN